MANKYDKYFTEVNPMKFFYPAGVENYESYEFNHYDYRDNDEAPHFMEYGKLGHGGWCTLGESPEGPAVNFIDPRIYYHTGYRSAPLRGVLFNRFFYLTMSLMSLDPDHLDDIGVTLHTWTGGGEESELHVIDKPTTSLLPPATLGALQYVVESHGKPGMVLIVCDNPLEAPIFSSDLPPGFDNYMGLGWSPPRVEPTPKGKGKYGKYFSEVNVKDLPMYPAHKGKLARIMNYSAEYNDEAPHFINSYLVYESGVGFGLPGGEKKLPVLPNGEDDNTTSYEPLLPHKHPFYQTYTFSPTTRENFPDLGGTVEFWMGEGEEAEQHIITKASTALVPKHTVHLPLYVREVHKPFTITTVLDTPIWAGTYTQKFPKGFKL